MDLPAWYLRFRPLLVLLLMLLSFAAGYAIHFVRVPSHPPHVQIRNDRYRYISPLLDCEISPQSSDAHPDPESLSEIVDEIAEAHIADGTVRSISVYFRELNSGISFGRKEQEMMTTGSLLKVALMIAVLKRAELDGSLLQQQIAYDGRYAHDALQHFKPKEPLRAGSSYTIDDLLFRMIAYSDNNAMQVLVDRFGLGMVDRTLEELRVPVDTSRGKDRMSVRSYTAFFRVLYNSSYLTDAMSEKAMEYLARSTFAEGIRSGVPQGIAVASKFGEAEDGGYRLSEFGVVYYPDHPYLLGVAARGGSPESLAHAISEVSEAVYEEMERQHPKQ